MPFFGEELPIMTSWKNPAVSFQEVQKFPMSWASIGLPLAILVVVWLPAIMNYEVVLWFLLRNGNSVGFGFYGFILIWLTVSTLLLGIIISPFYGKMTTEINQGGLYIDYFPFHLPLRFPLRRKISIENIALIEITTYKSNRYTSYPITYVAGGKQFHGIVYDTNQYTVKCSGKGVRLKFSELKSFASRLQSIFLPSQDILIGSQKPQELAYAIQQLVPNCKISKAY
jgi:hypothetical protein